MIDDKKDLEFNKSSENELNLGYGDTSSIGEENHTNIDNGLHQDSFEALSKEETYVEDNVIEEKVGNEENLVEDEKAEEVVEDEKISVESVDEVKANDESKSLESGVETEVLSTVDNKAEPSDLEMEKDSEVDTELDEYGNVIEVFAVQGRSINGTATFALNDTRLPAGVVKPSGTISHFGQTLGGVSLSVVDGTTTVELGRYKFQGTARPSLVLTGGILDAKAIVTAVESFDGNTIKLHATNTVVNTLRQFLINAANERIDEINGIKYPEASMVSSIDDRTYLTLALSGVLSANNSAASNPALSLSFKDLDSFIPKQVTLEFVASTIFTTGVDIVKNIVNEDSFVSNKPGSSRDSRNVSNINLSAEGIAVNIDFKAMNADNGLKTNTRYEFIGPNRDLVFFPAVDDKLSLTDSTIGYVEGLTMTQFKTGKQPPLFEVYQVKDNTGPSTTLSSIALISSLEDSQRGTALVTNIDFYSIDDTTFIDYDNLVSVAASNIALDVRGTSIKFKTLKIFDKDKTISKIEIEDDRMNKYPVSLAPIDSNNAEKGAYPQITGLQRATPYTFRKLHITAQPENESVMKTFQLMTLTGLESSTSAVTAIAHNISIRTSTFTEPKLFIEWDPDKAYVSTTSGLFTSTDANSTIPVFVPKLDIELPNKIKMPAVKNDKDSLRYVIEVESTDATIKNLTVNGLKGNEQYKVDRVDGQDKVYFIVTLYNLSENRDYGFLILELSYTDVDGRDLITRQVLNGINIITNVNITSTTSGGYFTATGIVQIPDQTLDNTTGPELTGNAIFNVTLFEAKTLEARKAEIPVFIDDMNGRFLRMEFVKPEANPNVEVELDGSILRFTNLEPKTEVVYKIDFIWRDKGGREQKLSKYAKISTPAVPAVDVKDTIITTTSSTAEIVFELFSIPKSPISGVNLSDNQIKLNWNKDRLILNLEGLKPNTEYKDLEITFKLDNGLTAKYKIKPFKTKEEIMAPTGPVAEFVGRVYEAALGRKPEVEGWRFWTQKLQAKELSVTQFIHDLMSQDEFVNRFLSKEEFIKMMYIIVVGRLSEEEGQKYWETKYDEYRLQESSLADLRRRIASEMMSESEFKDYVNKLGLKY